MREWGTGHRIALLVHGLGTDSGTWWRVGPELADRGYRVIAPDLTGHGRARRETRYSVGSWADQVAAAAPATPALALGASLGALVLAHAVGRVRPDRVAYEDPAWWPLPGETAARIAEFRAQRDWTPDAIRAARPDWPPESHAARAAALAAWDPASAAVVGEFGRTAIAAPTVPALVLAADPSELVTPPRADALRSAGFDVRVVAGTGHAVHHDDVDGFVAALCGWLGEDRG